MCSFALGLLLTTDYDLWVCHIVTVWHECLHPHWPKPCTHSYFDVHENSNTVAPSMSQPIMSQCNDLMSGWVPYLMLYITMPPFPVLMLVLAILLGYRGPTIVKPVLCLEPSQWDGAMGGFRQELYCLMEVSTASIKTLNHLWCQER